MTDIPQWCKDAAEECNRLVVGLTIEERHRLAAIIAKHYAAAEKERLTSIDGGRGVEVGPAAEAWARYKKFTANKPGDCAAGGGWCGCGNPPEPHGPHMTHVNTGGPL